MMRERVNNGEFGAHDYEKFKKSLFEEYDVVNNQKAEMCFGLAWQYGHAYGYSEILNYFSDLVDLIK